MLTEEERTEIEREVSHYPTRQAACIDAMQIVQRRHGFVSDESLNDIGALLGMRVDELEGVATFYNLIFRKPVGRHVILVCNSVTCWMLGADALRERVAAASGARVGETSRDGRFTLLPIVCLGACDHAPVMMVDDALYGDLDQAKIDEILERA